MRFWNPSIPGKTPNARHGTTEKAGDNGQPDVGGIGKGVKIPQSGRYGLLKGLAFDCHVVVLREVECGDMKCMPQKARNLG